MKSAIDFLKLISVIVALIFLCSCANRKQRIINEIHRLNDSIGIYRVKLMAIKIKRDSISDAYSFEYPATYFTSNSKERMKWILKEREAYREMISVKGKYDADNINKKNHYESKINIFKHRIDFLKIELYE